MTRPRAGRAERAAWRVFALATVVLVAIVGGVRLLAPARDGFDLLTGAIHVLIMLAALVFLGALVIRLGRDLDRAAAEQTTANALAAEASGRLAAQTRAAALVHDTVLSTLRVAGLAAVEPRMLAPQAAAALGQLRDLVGADQRAEQRASGAQFLRRLEQAVRAEDVAAQLTMRSEAEVGAGLTEGVQQALIGALRQAVGNSVRHAGTHATRAVRIALSKAAVRVEVADDGLGFDAAGVAADRLGVRTSITRTMHDVGGSAMIDSAPGEGTTVVLDWAASAQEPPLAAERDRRLLRGGIAAIAIVFLGTQLLLAGLATQNAEPWWTPLVSVAVIFTATEVLRLSPSEQPSPARAAAVLALILAAVAIGMFGAPFTYGDLWFVMAAALALMACAFRGSVGVAVIGAALIIGCVVLWGAAVGIGAAEILAVASRPALVVALAIALTIAVRRMQRRTAAELERASAAAACEAHAASESAELAAQASELLPLIEGMLERIASGEPLSETDRARANALNGLLRDRLRAGPLASEPVLAAAMRARARDVDVVLLDDSDGGQPFDPAFGPWIVAGIARAREQAVVRLLPVGRSMRLSVMIDGVPFLQP